MTHLEILRAQLRRLMTDCPACGADAFDVDELPMDELVKWIASHGEEPEPEHSKRLEDGAPVAFDMRGAPRHMFRVVLEAKLRGSLPTPTDADLATKPHPRRRA